MIIQNRDGSLLEEPRHKRNSDSRRYYAEIQPDDLDQQSSLIERIITMAFDVFGARHLEVRVHGAEENC